MERKIVGISRNRQITIPQEYFDALDFGNEAECILRDDGLLIRPVPDKGSGEFSEQILADLISQGYQGSELLDEFKRYSRAIRPAVRKLIEEADALAKTGEGRLSDEELFGAQE